MNIVFASDTKHKIQTNRKYMPVSNRTSGHSNLTSGRIVAALRRFSRNRQVAPMRTPCIESQKLVAMVTSLSCRVSAISAFCWPTTQIPSITNSRVAIVRTKQVIAILVPKLVAMATSLSTSGPPSNTYSSICKEHIEVTTRGQACAMPRRWAWRRRSSTTLTPVVAEEAACCSDCRQRCEK